MRSPYCDDKPTMPDHPTRSIIHVDMDAFYASVEQRDQPELSGRPVIVGGLGPRGVVAAANYEARRFGVHSAMPVLRARALCPGGAFLKPRMERYREVSAAIFGIFHEVTPLVEGLSLDEAFLDVTGSLKLFGGLTGAGHWLQDTIRARTGLVASVGMAHNKFIAKLASDARKPAGFLEVPAGHEQAFLDPMPVGRLWGIGRKTEPVLRRNGILTIGQLRRTDPAVLQNILGKRAGHFLALARGEDERLVVAHRPDKSISHETTFDRDLTHAEDMLSELQGQAEAVGRRLREQGLQARTVTVKIRDHRFVSVTRSRTLHAPTSSTRTVFEVARGLLQAWLREHANTPVRLLGVGVSGLEQAQDGPLPLDRAVDRIAERWGAGTIGGALALKRRRAPKRQD